MFPSVFGSISLDRNKHINFHHCFANFFPYEPRETNSLNNLCRIHCTLLAHCILPVLTNFVWTKNRHFILGATLLSQHNSNGQQHVGVVCFKYRISCGAQILCKPIIVSYKGTGMLFSNLRLNQNLVDTRSYMFRFLLKLKYILDCLIREPCWLLHSWIPSCANGFCLVISSKTSIILPIMHTNTMWNECISTIPLSYTFSAGYND